MTSLIETALVYAAIGIRVFPCRNKVPLITDWRNEASADPDAIKYWWHKWPNAQIAAITGEKFSVLDLDVKNGKDGFAAVPDWQTRTHVISRTQNGGAHLLFDAAGSPHCTSDVIAKGVDTRGLGGYVIMPPSPGYTWANGHDLTNLPPWPEDLRPPPRDPNATPNENAEAPAIQVAAALAAIPNDDIGWDEWKRIMMATYAATGGSDEGLEAFMEWSAKSTKHNQRYTAKEWKHLDRSPPNAIGAGTLFFLANEADPGWLDNLDAQLEAEVAACDASFAGIEPPSSPDVAETQGAGDPAFSVTSDPGPAAKAEAPKAELPKADDAKKKSNALPTFKHGLTPHTNTGWLVRDRIPETGAGLFLGQWGTFKTYLCLDLSVHVMLGWQWTGQPVYRQGGVLLFAPEGSGSVAMRLAAIVEHQLAGKDTGKIDSKRLPFEWTDICPPLLTGKNRENKHALTQMLDTAELTAARFKAEFGLPLSLIWIDTMATSANWSDESSNAEAAIVMRMLGHLSKRTGAAVMGVDHFGKNAEAGARGASAKEANSDFVLASIGKRLETGKLENPELVIRKMRDGPMGISIPFDSRVVDMGQDEHGYPVTQRVIDWSVSRDQTQKDRKAKTETVLLLETALNEVLAREGIMIDGRKLALRDDVREAFRAAYKANEPEIKNSAKDQRFRTSINEDPDVEPLQRDGKHYLGWTSDGEPF